MNDAVVDSWDVGWTVTPVTNLVTTDTPILFGDISHLAGEGLQITQDGNNLLLTVQEESPMNDEPGLPIMKIDIQQTTFEGAGGLAALAALVATPPLPACPTVANMQSSNRWELRQKLPLVLEHGGRDDQVHWMAAYITAPDDPTTKEVRLKVIQRLKTCLPEDWQMPAVPVGQLSRIEVFYSLIRTLMFSLELGQNPLPTLLIPYAQLYFQMAPALPPEPARPSTPVAGRKKRSLR